MRKMFVAAALALCASVALAQTPASAPQSAPTMRLRGTIEKVDAGTLTLKERGGETITLVFADNFSVTEIVPIELAAIQAGSFVGSAAMPQPDGTLRALAVAAR